MKTTPLVLIITTIMLARGFAHGEPEEGQVSPLWDVPLPASVRTKLHDTSFEQFFSILEEASKDLDPAGRGLRIVCPAMNGHQIGFSGGPTNLSLRMVLETINARFYLQKDVAVLFPRTGRAVFRTAGILVRCLDDQTEKIVHGVQFKSLGDPVLCLPATNDCFLLAVPYRAGYGLAVGGYRCELAKPVVVLDVTAPGYEQETQRIATEDPWTPTVPLVEIRLRLKGAEGPPLHNDAGGAGPRSNQVPEDTARKPADPQH